jgi:hypothetical protein
MIIFRRLMTFLIVSERFKIALKHQRSETVKNCHATAKNGHGMINGSMVIGEER